MTTGNPLDNRQRYSDPERPPWPATPAPLFGWSRCDSCAVRTTSWCATPSATT